MGLLPNTACSFTFSLVGSSSSPPPLNIYISSLNLFLEPQTCISNYLLNTYTLVSTRHLKLNITAIKLPVSTSPGWSLLQSASLLPNGQAPNPEIISDFSFSHIYIISITICFWLYLQDMPRIRPFLSASTTISMDQITLITRLDYFRSPSFHRRPLRSILKAVARVILKEKQIFLFFHSKAFNGFSSHSKSLQGSVVTTHYNS